MPGRIIDCCSLINLYTGWGGLRELSSLSGQWYICEAVMRETEYTREYGKDGAPVLVALDFDQLTRSEFLQPIAAVSDEELEDYLDFASEVDDGEAQALAIAKHRGFALLTDDRKAIRLAARPDVSVTSISTAEVLQVWASLNQQNAKRLHEVIARIERLARFAPRADSPDYDWWSQYREQ